MVCIVVGVCMIGVCVRSVLWVCIISGYCCPLREMCLVDMYLVGMSFRVSCGYECYCTLWVCHLGCLVGMCIRCLVSMHMGCLVDMVMLENI